MTIYNWKKLSSLFELIKGIYALFRHSQKLHTINTWSISCYKHNQYHYCNYCFSMKFIESIALYLLSGKGRFTSLYGPTIDFFFLYLSAFKCCCSLWLHVYCYMYLLVHWLCSIFKKSNVIFDLGTPDTDIYIVYIFLNVIKDFINIFVYIYMYMNWKYRVNLK